LVEKERMEGRNKHQQREKFRNTDSLAVKAESLNSKFWL